MHGVHRVQLLTSRCVARAYTATIFDEVLEPIIFAGVFCQRGPCGLRRLDFEAVGNEALRALNNPGQHRAACIIIEVTCKVLDFALCTAQLCLEGRNFQAAPRAVVAAADLG